MFECLTKEPIDIEKIKNHDHPECGGICVFEGVVRNHHDGKTVTRLIYEAYEPMAEKELKKLVVEIESEWPETHVSVLHRLGNLEIGETAVGIVVWAPHRKEAFQACEAMINRLKKRVPIWKREFYSDGTIAWVSCQHHHAESSATKEKVHV